ncbi:hypothetical protein ACSV5S_10985 [Agrobacterium deltaense]|uniref:hypothetical protein n=1 Tax=Agrobacterium deltaense TaxID=1183412 RepID=UPI003FD62F52
MKITAILGNIAALVFVIGLAVFEGHSVRPAGWALLTAFLLLFLLNIVLLSASHQSNLRVFRMIGYWLDAKERELKDRSEKKP